MPAASGGARQDRGGVSLDTAAGISVVSLAGEADLADVGELRRVMAHVGARARPVVVDLSRTTFMDSTVVGCLCALARDRERAALPVALVVSETTSYPVRNLLRLVGLTPALAVFPDVAAARDALTAG
jgi:anti-sigma B factor antagonist